MIIPARDEEATIEAIVAETLRTVPGVEVIVVDDGSTDGTAKAAEAAGARVLAHPFASGNGAALKSGIRAVKRPYLVLMDADGQHAPVEIPRLLAALSEVDMVVGARPEWAHASLLRSLGNRALARVAGWLSGRPIPDLTSGFRALRADYARACLPLMPQGYSSPTTLTMALLERGAFVSFLRLERAGERRGGRSRISLG
ncbi:MAG: glycosyltransferase family 2 protein, partial [Planctomycetes bacterium]|nr:glycosyltransferase family 2 protein [Planctomycetota bacterium]